MLKPSYSSPAPAYKTRMGCSLIPNAGTQPPFVYPLSLDCDNDTRDFAYLGAAHTVVTTFQVSIANLGALIVTERGS